MNDVIPMPSTKIDRGRYIVLGTSHEVIVAHGASGFWYIIVDGQSRTEPFPTKRAALQRCQEDSTL